MHALIERHKNRNKKLNEARKQKKEERTWTTTTKRSGGWRRTLWCWWRWWLYYRFCLQIIGRHNVMLVLKLTHSCSLTSFSLLTWCHYDTHNIIYMKREREGERARARKGKQEEMTWKLLESIVCDQPESYTTFFLEENREKKANKQSDTYSQSQCWFVRVLCTEKGRRY